MARDEHAILNSFALQLPYHVHENHEGEFELYWLLTRGWTRDSDIMAHLAELPRPLSDYDMTYYGSIQFWSDVDLVLDAAGVPARKVM